MMGTCDSDGIVVSILHVKRLEEIDNCCIINISHLRSSYQEKRARFPVAIQRLKTSNKFPLLHSSEKGKIFDKNTV